MLLKRLLLSICCAFNILSYSQNKKIEKDITQVGKENLLPYVKTYKIQKEISVIDLDNLISKKEINEIESKAIHPTSNDFFWIKFDIIWTKEHKNKILEINNPHLNNLVLYEKSNTNTFKKIGFGGDKAYKFNERSYSNRRFVFPLKNTFKKTSYYFMVDNRKALMVIPMQLWDKQKFLETEKKENIFYTIYFSFIFFIGFISLVISFITKKRIFLYYGLYIFSLWGYLFTLLGFSFQYIYPNNTNITSDTRYITVTLLIITAISFVISFLKMKEYANHIFKIIRTIQYIFITFLIVYFINQSIFYEFHIALTYFFRTIYLVIFSCILISVFKIRKIATKRVQLFAISIFFVILGFCTFIAIQLEFIPIDWFSINPVIIGVGIEVCVLTMAMFYILKNLLLKSTSLKTEKDNLSIEFELLQIELNTFKQKKNEEDIFKKGENITLKSKALINSKDILYIKSDGHYVEYYLESQNNPEIDRNSLNKIIEILPSNTFIRIHKSYIVNIHRIKIINSTKVMLDNGVWINLSRTYKQQLKDILHKED